MKKILVINVGSSSKKYSFFDGKDLVANSHYEKENGEYIVSRKFKINIPKKEGLIKIKISESDYKNSLKLELDFLIREKIIKDKNDIWRLGFRIVGRGDYFLKNREINKKYKQELKKDITIIPLHIKIILEEIKISENIFPRVEKIGVSDSVFFAKMPLSHKYYALPYNLAEKLELKRFSYHGISASSAITKTKNIFKTMPKRIIICHLGSGCGVIGVKNGIGVSASTGFGPLEGLVMSTRVGDIDPSILIYLIEDQKMKVKDLKEMLNKKSGLLGLSGTDDMREVIKQKFKSDKRAQLAFDVFIDRVKKYIGGYMVQLGGLDLIIFTGTIGERSDIVREAVLKDLEGLGIKIDKKKNKFITTKNIEGFIEDKKSRIKIVVLKSDEMVEINKEVLKFIKK